MSSRAVRLALKGFRYAIALGVLLWVASGIDWGRAIDLLSGVGSGVLVAVLAITVLEFGSRFSMWYVLLNGRRRTRFATAARIDLIIKVVNHLLPSRVSGHSIAPLLLQRFTDHDWRESVSIAGLNTGLYAALYGAVALVGIAVFADDLSRGLLLVLGLSTGLYLGVGATVLLAGRRLELAGGLFDAIGGIAGRLPLVGERAADLVERAPSFTEQSAAAFRELSSDPAILVPYALGWAGTLMVFPGLRVWLLLGSLDAAFEPAILIPLALVTAYSVTLLPLTPGGIGIAEASASLVFIALGVPGEIAVPVIVLDRFLGVYLPPLLGVYPVLGIDLSELRTSGD